MRRLALIATSMVVFLGGNLFAQDSTEVDNTVIAPACKNLEYLTELFAFKGAPQNLGQDRKVVVLISHGYMVGFSESRKQPVWAAYRVSGARQDTHYDRPHFFYDDLRLPDSMRIGPSTFPGFDRGHMVPNFAINKQYGKLGQMETFFMSNICPQKAGLNRGPWARLERAIVDEYAPAWEHIWVIAGPIFDEQPEKIRRERGELNVEVDVPSHFYMILIDIHGQRNTGIDILGLRFSQDITQSERLGTEHIASIDDLEEVTQLNFFPRFTPGQQGTHEANAAPALWTVEGDGVE